MFKDLLNKDLEISLEEFSMDVGLLPKDKVYVIAVFGKYDNPIVYGYGGGNFFKSTIDNFTVLDYKFKSLARAYSYFEEMYYK